MMLHSLLTATLSHAAAMQLIALKLRNFRAYLGDVTVPIGDLTSLIGKNDIGKSSVLEAIGIFLGGQGLKADPTDLCVDATSDEMQIGCVFSGFPTSLSIDTTSVTSLSQEQLLNGEGYLEIHHIYKCRDGKLTDKGLVAIAEHPSAEGLADLLSLKNAELKTRARELGSDLQGVDQRNNTQLREAIRRSVGTYDLRTTEVPLNKEDGKAIWEQLAEHLPLFVLFQADRPSTDEDAEAQDPMKVAVKQAIAESQDVLTTVKNQVESKVMDVAERTLEKLRELDRNLGNELRPQFQSEPKWDGIFKLSLMSDRGIPLNKRGSGLRRLVLLSFFRAEAERKRQVAGHRSIVYAIEEPEASQHPENQRMLVAALIALASNEDCQVVLTTHVPGLAGLAPIDSLRHILRREDGSTMVDLGTNATYKAIANDLGVLPDSRVRVFLCVEGPNDVAHLIHLSNLLRSRDGTLPDLQNDPRLVMLSLGGSTLKDWVYKQYLRRTGIPEIHIYDRGDVAAPQF